MPRRIKKVWFSDEQLKRPKRWICDYLRCYPTEYMQEFERRERWAKHISNMAIAFQRFSVPPFRAADIIQVQPMSLPTEQVFYLDFVYGDGLPE